MILDRRGIELAISTESATIGINPHSIYDIDFTAKYLADPLGMSQSKIKEMIQSKNSYFLLKREIDVELGNKISTLSLPGVRVEKEFKRIYPQGFLASNYLGFTGMDDDRALAGLENEYNMELLSVPDQTSERGNDIHLTLDSLIQYRLEKSLKRVYESTRSKRAIGVFMDINNGDVIAMASFPNFDPNHYGKYPTSHHTNWAIRHVYEPGSTMKIFVALMLINEGVLSQKERFFCPGYVEFGNSMIRCTDRHGSVNLSEILQSSCNVGIIKASQKVSDKTYYSYLQKYGFGQKTGLTIHENNGYLPPLSSWRKGSPYFYSIGQGLSVTPIQLVRSAAAVVNGGFLLNPRAVEKITNSYGEPVHRFQTRSKPIQIKEQSRKVILDSMTRAVKYGTGRRAYLQDITIAGKTGTGQKATPGKGYQEGLWSASFLGFFPAEDPKFVGLVLFDEPEGNIYTGGGLAAPVFKEVVEEILPLLDSQTQAKSYKLKPIQNKTFKFNPNLVPNLVGLSKIEAIAALRELKLRFTMEGSGFVKEQLPVPGTRIEDSTVVRILLER